MNFKVTHKITALTLVVLLCLNNLKTVVTVTDFIYRQAEIAKNLCIQKDNQQGCNGKCQLTLALAEKNSEQGAADLPQNNRTKLDVFEVSSLKDFNFYNTEFLTPKSFSVCNSLIVFKQPYLEINTPPPKYFI